MPKKRSVKKRAPQRAKKTRAKKSLDQKPQGVRTGRSLKRNGSQDGTKY